jgi:ATP-dependent RNA helicase SUPV3L1/SUV3
MGGPRQDKGAKTYSSRPAKKEKQIDPDNPFAAALMGLKQGD